MDRYEEVGVIGRGQYGRAAIVREVETRELYVMKKIPVDLLSETEKSQTYQEVRLLSELRHPNIVEYKESFLEEETLHIVMAYCEGGDLAAHIKRMKESGGKIVDGRAKERKDGRNRTGNPADGDINVHEEEEEEETLTVTGDGKTVKASQFFSEEQILDWFVQIAMAMHYIHSKRILHRDLKANNVFLTKSNIVKLGDFGIARVLDSSFDQAKTVVGTPFYLSPEVCENKPYSYKSDMWALGCILYEMCALRHAFEADNLLGLVYKIVGENHPPIPSHYRTELHELLASLLAKSPADRPSIWQVFQLSFIKKHIEDMAKSGGSLGLSIQRPYHLILQTPSPPPSALPIPHGNNAQGQKEFGQGIHSRFQSPSLEPLGGPPETPPSVKGRKLGTLSDRKPLRRPLVVRSSSMHSLPKSKFPVPGSPTDLASSGSCSSFSPTSSLSSSSASVISVGSSGPAEDVEGFDEDQLTARAEHRPPRKGKTSLSRTSDPPTAASASSGTHDRTFGGDSTAHRALAADTTRTRDRATRDKGSSSHERRRKSRQDRPRATEPRLELASPVPLAVPAPPVLARSQSDFVSVHAPTSPIGSPIQSRRRTYRAEDQPGTKRRPSSSLSSSSSASLSSFAVPPSSSTSSSSPSSSCAAAVAANVRYMVGAQSTRRGSTAPAAIGQPPVVTRRGDAASVATHHSAPSRCSSGRVSSSSFSFSSPSSSSSSSSSPASSSLSLRRQAARAAREGRLTSDGGAVTLGHDVGDRRASMPFYPRSHSRSHAPSHPASPLPSPPSAAAGSRSTTTTSSSRPRRRFFPSMDRIIRRPRSQGKIEVARDDRSSRRPSSSSSSSSSSAAAAAAAAASSSSFSSSSFPSESPVVRVEEQLQLSLQHPQGQGQGQVRGQAPAQEQNLEQQQQQWSRGELERVREMTKGLNVRRSSVPALPQRGGLILLDDIVEQERAAERRQKGREDEHNQTKSERLGSEEMAKREPGHRRGSEQQRGEGGRNAWKHTNPRELSAVGGATRPEVSVEHSTRQHEVGRDTENEDEWYYSDDFHDYDEEDDNSDEDEKQEEVEDEDKQLSSDQRDQTLKIRNAGHEEDGDEDKITKENARRRPDRGPGPRHERGDRGKQGAERRRTFPPKGKEEKDIERVLRNAVRVVERQIPPEVERPSDAATDDRENTGREYAGAAKRKLLSSRRFSSDSSLLSRREEEVKQEAAELASAERKRGVRRGSSLKARVKLTREKLEDSLGKETFEKVYVYLRRMHDLGQSNCASELIEMVGEDNVGLCQEVDQLLYFENMIGRQ